MRPSLLVVKFGVVHFEVPPDWPTPTLRTNQVEYRLISNDDDDGDDYDDDDFIMDAIIHPSWD